MKLFSNTSCSLIFGGRTYSLNCGDQRFKQGYQLLVAGKDEEFISLLAKTQERAFVEKEQGFTFEDDKIFYKSFEINGALKTKIQSMMRDKLGLTPFVNFMERASKNASRKSALELFDFLSYRELAITLEGTFLPYKGVNEDYWSVHGNPNTVVLQGETDTRGRLKNTIGATIEVERSSVDDDRQECSSNGLHVGSLSYSQSFGSRIVMVEVCPSDAVAVPTDCSFQKLRVCKYKVLSDYVSEIMAPVVEVNSSEIKELRAPESVKDKVRRYISNKITSGEEEISIRKIANALKDGTTQALVNQIVSEMGYFVWPDGCFHI